jgi:parallel beta-helix repeat protein
MKKLLIISTLMLFLMSSSFAATYYVDNAGNDNNTGLSESSPWKTIAKVNSKTFSSGDQVLFKRGGIWYETLTVKQNNILFDAYGSGSLPIIDGQLTRSNNIYISGRSGVTIRNLELRNNGGSGSIRVNTSSNILIENCVVYATAKGIFFETSTACIVRNNTITTPDYINTQTDGIYSQRNDGNTYENNYIVISNTAETQHNDGIQCYLDANITARGNYIEQRNFKTGNAQGIYATNSSGKHYWYNNVINTPNIMSNSLGFKNLETTYTGNVEVYHNTVVTKGGNGLCVVNAPAFIAKNNIFISNGTTYAIYISGTINNFSNLNYNIYYNKGTSEASAYLYNYGGTHSISQLRSKGAEVNGMFGSPAMDSEWTPLEGCIAVDKGSNLPSPYNVDKNGNPRPFNLVSDMGAIERITGTTINPPAVPGSLAAGNVTSTEINLTWIDKCNTEDGFKIERKLSGGSWAEIKTVGVNVTSYKDVQLSPSTGYYYRVRSFNAGGASAYSNECNAVTGSGLTLPATPGSLAANNITSTEVTLTWIDGCNTEDGFKIERRLGGGSWSEIKTVGSDITTYKDVQLSPSTSYYYRIRSYNTAGTSSYSNECNAVTMAGAIVEDLFIEAQSGSLYNGAYLGIFPNSLASKVVGFSSKSSYAAYSFTINVESAYYIQGRFYHNSKGSGSFSVQMGTNGTRNTMSYSKIIKQWKWGNKVFLGVLQPGTYTVRITNSKPDDSYIDMLLITTDPLYTESPGGNYEDQLTYEIEGVANYPNPFNPQTTVMYNIPSEGKITLKVYDILGNVVAVLEDGVKNAGTHQAVFNGNKFSSGIYILELRTEDAVHIHKMNLLK